MERYKNTLGWTDGMAALIYHGQRADTADIFNLTSLFEIERLYSTTPRAGAKLMLGYCAGVISRNLAGYSGGHYLLTARGGRRQRGLLEARGLRPEQVWIMLP